MILLIDNYDSFVHNLARYLQRLGQETLVVRNDEISVEDALARRPAAIVLSPGPCTPSEAGCSIELVRQAAGNTPILGVCLGHQAIGAAFGAKVVRAREPMHGRTSQVTHHQTGVFAGLPSPLTVGRYHSLVVDEPTLPKEFQITARADDGTIMALAHRRWPIYGVQFHPESILTQGGYHLLANFLKLAGVETAMLDCGIEHECPAQPDAPPLPAQPVTF